MGNLPLNSDKDFLEGNGWVSKTGIKAEAIKAKWLFDSENGKVQNNRIIFVKSGKIDEIIESTEFNDDSEILLDLSQYYVIPGLIDSHAHLSSVYDPFEPNAYISICAANSATLTTHVIRNAQRCLRMGITCIRDMPGFTNFINQEGIAVREASIRDMLALPRIIAYGWIEPTAGHMDLALPANLRNDPTVYADSPYEVRRMVRRMVREGVDGFKSDVSGGLGGRMEETWWKKYTDEELLALTDEAHGVGKRVAVHAYTDNSILQAIQCGVDTIEHGIYLTDKTADLMAERRIPLVPTLSVRSQGALKLAQAAGAVSPHQLKKREQVLKDKNEYVLKAFKRGVIIATGTDAYFTLRGNFWGFNSEEINLLINAGLKSKDALRAATIGAAIAVGLNKEIGIIKKGMFADLVALKQSPLENPNALTNPDNIVLVIKEGEVVAGSHDGLQDVLSQISKYKKEVIT